DLLYMPLLDLQQHLKQELLNNPFLDMVEPEDDEEDEGEVQEETANPEAEPEKDEKGEIDWEEILLDGFDAGGRREEHEEREYYEPVTVDSRDLSDHLRDQVSLLDLNPRQMYLADEFIGNINEDGYLACGLDKILEGVNESVQKAADEIAKLDPKPGLVYSDASDNYIIPDLIVDKIDGRYHVFLNDANLPRLKLSKAYQEIARDKKKFDGENKEFISNKLNSANWMIQAIEQRRQTMLKVMNYIVERQREFFEKGIQYLKPLTLREVAEVINMHESTVSRVTN